MNYDLSEEQQMLKDAARKFLAKECTGEFIREMEEDEKGYTPDLWKKMVELGWVGLLIPEKYDGFEMSFLDLSVLLYEMGYACVPGPFFSTAVLGAITLIEAGNEAQKEALLPQVAGGERIMTLAWTEKGGSYLPGGISATAEKKGDQYVLSGSKLFVPDAHVADTIICAARTEAGGDPENGISLFILDGKSSGLTIETLDTIGGDKQCEIILDQVEVAGENLLGEFNQGWAILTKVLEKAAVAKCAEMSGGAQKVIDFVVPYAKERQQFGQPIGSFQAIQHYCADILTYVDTTRFMTYQASWRISEGLSFEKEASMSKAWVSDSYQKLLALGHQIMGGTGFMEEHDLQLYFRRAKAAELAFGDADFHRERVAEEMGL
ncbi:acyl-CoA dehydrogenase family protein [Thermodesulfobacteriota bacterium]